MRFISLIRFHSQNFEVTLPFYQSRNGEIACFAKLWNGRNIKKIFFAADIFAISWNPLFARSNRSIVHIIFMIKDFSWNFSAKYSRKSTIMNGPFSKMFLIIWENLQRYARILLSICDLWMRILCIFHALKAYK